MTQVRHSLLPLTVVFVGWALGASVYGQPATAQTDGAGQRPSRGTFKAYKDVITAEANTTRGVFTVHRVKDRLYYEIPPSELDRDFLWFSMISQATYGVTLGGTRANPERIVRWIRHDTQVWLCAVSYDMTASGTPMVWGVQRATKPAIIMTFPIETAGTGDAPVIDVTRLFTTDVPEITLSPAWWRTRTQLQSFDAARAFIERVVVHPDNLDVEATHTYTPVAKASTSSASVLMRYSMRRLPERPMVPRLYDGRTVFHPVKQDDFGLDRPGSPTRQYIARWRLEKKDPAAAISDPVTPLVFWIDAGVPDRWRPYIRQGVMQWQAAFEAAGFSNALVVKQAPSPAEDPSWSPDDARHTVIRWEMRNCGGGGAWRMMDPRSGEILRSYVLLCHGNADNWSRRYFVEAGPLDPRARTLPLPDDLRGSLIAYTTAHEVGHTLGLDHNMKASSSYSLDKLRDRTWLEQMGHLASVMDYSRFNYVAQPEDGIDPVDLIPRVGPNDVWMVRWGYTPIAAAKTPDDERATLDRWAREQDQTPWFRYGDSRPGYDPGTVTEAVGDADALAATGLGLKNLQRVMTMLVPATTAHAGDTYDELKATYEQLLDQWVRELQHVAAVVGGVERQLKYVGQPGAQFSPVPRARQVAAADFLQLHAFTTPAFLMPSDLLQRIEMIGIVDRISDRQQAVLEYLLTPTRVKRLIELETLAASLDHQAYAPTKFLADLRQGLWKELTARDVRVDTFRRRLQQAYVAILCERSRPRRRPSVPIWAVSANTASAPFSIEEPALFKAELRALDRAVSVARARTTDRATAAHLEDVSDRIARALNTDDAVTPPTTSRPETTEDMADRLWSGDDADPDECLFFSNRVPLRPFNEREY